MAKISYQDISVYYSDLNKVIVLKCGKPFAILTLTSLRSTPDYWGQFNYNLRQMSIITTNYHHYTFVTSLLSLHYDHACFNLSSLVICWVETSCWLVGAVRRLSEVEPMRSSSTKGSQCINSLVTATCLLFLPSSMASMTSSGLQTKRSVHPWGHITRKCCVQQPHSSMASQRDTY